MDYKAYQEWLNLSGDDWEYAFIPAKDWSVVKSATKDTNAQKASYAYGVWLWRSDFKALKSREGYSAIEANCFGQYVYINGDGYVEIGVHVTPKGKTFDESVLIIMARKKYADYFEAKKRMGNEGKIKLPVCLQQNH